MSKTPNSRLGAGRLVATAALVVGLGWTARAQDEVLNPSGTFVRHWQVCGPFEAHSVTERAVENEGALEAAPDRPVAGVPWKVVKLKDDILDFEDAQVFGKTNSVIAYAFAEIESERDGYVLLGLGSDDTAMAWWNGRQVLVQNLLRGLHVSEDQLYLKMNKGRNTLLVKVYDDGGGWQLAVDIRPAEQATWTWRTVLPMTDEDFLDLVERKSFDYFWKEAHPVTGLIADSAPAAAVENRSVSSVAAVGFGLTAICVGESRGWITRAEARERVVKTLRFALDHVEQEHGFFYHFVDPATGKRDGTTEVSSIDTAFLIAGALTCRNYFHDKEIADLANRLYERVDWLWMMNGKGTMCMGWKPEGGFLDPYWDVYSEHMVMYLLAMASPTHPIPAETWYAWKRPVYGYNGLTYVQAVPLFLHQYSHSWVDFRDKRDAVADYFRNSGLATRAHREFCISLTNRFPAYGENLWGLTASKGPAGYMVWGGPPPTLEYPIDGTVVPCAAGGSVPFVPELTIPVLREIYDRHREKAWGRYGFLDAFNPNTGWVGDGYIAIDVAPLVLMIENHRTGRVWEWFMECPEMRRAMKLAGFKQTGRDMDKADIEYLRKLAKETWDCIAYFVNPDTQMPYDTSDRGEHTSASNVGLYLMGLAAARDMGFIPADEALRKAGIVLDSIEKFPTWHGFAQCWHGVADLAPSSNDVWVSVVDTGNLGLALVAAGQAFPELGPRCQALVGAMDWTALYDTNALQLYGGYDMVNDRLNPDWRIDMLATDSRGAAFLAVASGDVPAGVWDKLQRSMEERYHVKYLRPGWVGGGLFMQYITGIFLNEKDSFMGRSAANLAYDNMRHADEMNLPAWGWSSCADPEDGPYIGWGKLRDEVVTPHASVLAIEDFPKEVLANLYELQRRGGRAPWRENGADHAFGFRDSLNLKSGRAAKGYLVLDQGLLFLSLANFLENGLVRRYFHADPGVQEAVRKIGELAEREGGPDVSVFEPGLGKMVAQPQISRTLEVRRAPAAPAIDADLSDWTVSGDAVIRYPEFAEFGVPPNKERFEGKFSFAWDSENLYIAMQVQEDELVCTAPANELYKDDAVEMFFDPKANNFDWGKPEDFQIGFSPTGPAGTAQVYAWFQNKMPAEIPVAGQVTETPEGADYVIETRIPWSFLGLSDVKPGTEVPASFALHTVNRSRTSSAKINWSFRTDVDRIHLGVLKLVE